MGFYVTTENPKLMLRENHKTKSSEYIFICQDDLYIASTTPEEILQMLPANTRSIFILNLIFHMILVEQLFVNSRNILKSYMQMLICFSKTNYQEI